MSKSKLNKNTESGFVPIRRGIYEHISNGRMTGKEWMVYSTLHLKADHQTGICLKVSAPILGHLLQIKPRQVNRILTSLENKQYIRRLNHRGQIRHYPVVINKYLTVPNGLLIDAHNTKSLKEIAWYTEHDCLLTDSYMTFNCPANVLQMSCLQEVKKIRIKEVKKKGQKAPTPKSFTPPTADQVREYATTIGFPEIDAERFVEWYAADDWCLKDGSPMRSWKRTVVSWKSTERKREKDEQAPIPKPAMPTAEQLKIATEAEKQ